MTGPVDGGESDERRDVADGDRSMMGSANGVDVDASPSQAEFERRLAAVVEWAVEHEVVFDRAWTIGTGEAIGYDVMAEFVYVEQDSSE